MRFSSRWILLVWKCYTNDEIIVSQGFPPSINVLVKPITTMLCNCFVAPGLDGSFHCCDVESSTFVEVSAMSLNWLDIRIEPANYNTLDHVRPRMNDWTAKFLSGAKFTPHHDNSLVEYPLGWTTCNLALTVMREKLTNTAHHMHGCSLRLWSSQHNELWDHSIWAAPEGYKYGPSLTSRL